MIFKLIAFNAGETTAVVKTTPPIHAPARTTWRVWTSVLNAASPYPSCSLCGETRRVSGWTAKSLARESSPGWRSVIIIEHHQAVMAHADWIIDLGPGAGYDGSRIVFEGTPADLVAARSTLTGEHLAAYVGT